MKGFCLGAVALLLMAGSAYAAFDTVIFSETFDDASSASNFIETYYTPEDVYSEYGFDYSATGNSRLTAAIGAAPNGGSTSGLLLAANLTGAASDAGINVYPFIAAQTGGYKLSFDVWVGVNNVSGSTEMLQAGAQASGTQANIDAGDFNLRDGDWFELTAEGGISNDFITFTKKGGTQIAETLLPNSDPGLQAAYPNPPYPVAGAPGEGWSTVEVIAGPANTAFYLNGVLVADVQDSDWTSGLPFIGYSDIFSSVAGGDSPLVGTGGNFDPFNASFAIIDNVEVAVPEPASFGLLALGALVLVRRR